MTSSGRMRSSSPAKRDPDRVHGDEELLAFCKKVDALRAEGLTCAIIAERLGAARDTILARMRRRRALLESQQAPPTATVFEALIAELTALDPYHPDRFPGVVTRALLVLAIDDAAFAHICSARKATSVQAVRRWKTGYASPSPSFRKFVYDTLVDEAKKRLTLPSHPVDPP